MRDKILELAQEQMKCGGYNQLNFANIAKELGTTRANLHYHFKNKESLAIEVTKRFMADQEADFAKAAAQFPGNFPKLLEAMEEDLWNHHKCHGRVGSCVCAQIIRHPDAPDSLLELAEGHFDKFRVVALEQVKHSIESGVLRDDIDAESVAAEACCMMIGLSEMALMIPPDHHKKVLSGTLKRWVSNYLK
jgi:AcrR family transcriptional regulator